MEENKYKDVLKGIVEIIRNAEHSDISFASICTYICDHCPELKESEDERMLREIKRYIKEQGDKPTGLPNGTVAVSDMIAWLEKQGGITKLSEEEQNRFAKGVLKRCALSFIDYLDAHKYEGKMCVSNRECEDIEYAFHNAMWGRLHRYYCKYLEKQGEFRATISVDKMVEEFENFKVMAGRIPPLAEIDAYRKGVTDVLSKVLIKEEKPITLGSKKAEGKLGEMIAASKEPAESGEEDKQLTHKEVSKKSEQDGKKWIDEKVYWKEREELFEDGKQEVINNPAKYGLIKDENHIANDSKKVESKAWSEEDEENYRNATTIISRQRMNAYTIEIMNDCSRCIKWLSSIKERMN